MARKDEVVDEKRAAEERPFAHLRATPEERARILAKAPPPRSLEEWLGSADWATEEELTDLNGFLQELEALRQYDLVRQEERLKALDG